MITPCPSSFKFVILILQDSITFPTEPIFSLPNGFTDISGEASDRPYPWVIGIPIFLKKLSTFELRAAPPLNKSFKLSSPSLCFRTLPNNLGAIFINTL